MNYHPSLRLTPSNSPHFRSPSPRSPTRTSRFEEAGLRLTKVIGTTTASANAFDCLPSTRQCAFTAGAAAVLATIDDDLNVNQKFFRAYPGSAAISRDGGGWPSTPTPSDARSRVIANLKEQGTGTSPLSSSTRDWQDSPNGRSTTAKDRVKAATSVAISRNGKWLALGETGYKPRISIFSAKDDSSETPVALLAEHSFGVHALSFSPDSKYLASLGTVNDGFLFVWAIDDRTGAATLHASNKCTTPIHSMCWMGQSIVTAGLRYVKVWKPHDDSTTDVRGIDSPRGASTPRQRGDLRSSDFGNSILGPRHRVLAGKNSLLGDMLDATFVVIVPLSDSKALICTEGGEVCLLDDSDKLQTINLVENANMRITAARLDESEKSLHVVGLEGQSRSFNLHDLMGRATSSTTENRRQSFFPTKPMAASGVAVIATGAIPGVVIEIKSDRMIRLSKTGDSSDALETRQLPAHDDPVLGVRPLQSSSLPDAAFLSFSSCGNIRFWTRDGTSVGQAIDVPVESSTDMYGLTNELRAVAPSSDGSTIAVGDRYGTITFVDIQSKQILHRVRAHTAEILDIACFERNGIELLASASRDRTLQTFICSRERLELLQTLDEHAGAVTGLLMSEDRNQLLSCSADRTVVIRDAMLRNASDPRTLAFVITRTITLKSAPTSFCLGPDGDSIYVSTVDRCIGKYSLRAGQGSHSFKCSDSENGEAVTVSKIIYTPALNGNPAIAAVSSSDKSVRLYTDFGTLIARDWGHTEGITDMALIPRMPGDGSQDQQSHSIVTVAADSTIFLWGSLVSSTRSGSQPSDPLALPEANGVPLAPPLRKVLSYSEMSKIRRESTIDETSVMDPPSPPVSSTPTQASSPHRLRKKTSRLSMAPTPRLEPPARANFDPSRRRSVRQRSPSPPSPRAQGRKEVSRRPSLGMSLRSKSTDNILNNGSSSNVNSAGFGTLTASTESLCRTLRLYRKKLVTTPSSDSISQDTLRELDKELRLTLRAVGERSQGKSLDEAMVAKLLDQVSDKMVGLLDDKIKERVESEVRKTSDGFISGASRLESPAELDEEQLASSEAVAGAKQGAEAVLVS